MRVSLSDKMKTDNYMESSILRKNALAGWWLLQSLKKDKKGSIYGNCRCDCDNELDVMLGYLFPEGVDRYKSFVHLRRIWDAFMVRV